MLPGYPVSEGFTGQAVEDYVAQPAGGSRDELALF
jgi:hypothetical protein